MPAADQSTAGVDRQAATDFEIAVLDRFPALAWPGDPDVVYGQVFRRGAAVMFLEPVDAIHVDTGAGERVLHGMPYVRTTPASPSVT